MTLINMVHVQMRADQDRQRRKVEEDDKIQQKKDIQRKKVGLS